MIEHVTVTSLKHLMDTGSPTIIDVRELWEFEQGHVPGARWLPMSQVPERRQEFASDQPVYLVCRSGNRSGQVAMWLAQQGIRTINVAGGTAEWQSHGYPIDSTPAERTLA